MIAILLITVLQASNYDSNLTVTTPDRIDERQWIWLREQASDEQDFGCNTDLDCQCMVVPYEAPDMTKTCVEYRKDQAEYEKAEGDQ